MSQLIVKANSKSGNWTQNRRYKVGQPTIHSGQNWINLTGANSEPGVGADWKSISTVSEVLSTKEPFTSIAAQTVFNLSSIPNNVDVYVNRIPQIHIIDYTLAANVVTLTEAQEAGSEVEIRKF